MRRAEGKCIAEQVAENLHNAPFHTAHYKRPVFGIQQHHRVIIIIARRGVQIGKRG